MQEIIDGLKRLKFESPDMEKRRLHLIDAFENRVSIPSDQYDLWILNKIIPGTLDEESVKKIDEWLASR